MLTNLFHENARSRAISLLMLVFLSALAARLIYIFLRGPHVAPDTASYMKIATNIQEHWAFSLDAASPYAPTIRRPPLYPAFLALLGWFGLLSPLVVALIQAMLDAAVAALIFKLARMMVSVKLAFSTALIYAIYPGAIAASASLLTESMFTALCVAAISFVVFGTQKDRLWFTASGGAMLGLAILCRPFALPLLAVLPGVLVLTRSQSRRWLHGAAIPLMAALVIAPWAVRCSRLAGQVVLVQGVSAANFYIPTRWDWDQRDQTQLWQRFAQEDEYGRRLVSSRNPRQMVEADRFGFGQAVRNVEAGPGEYLKSRIRSFPFLFLTSFDSFTGINKSFGALIAERSWLLFAIKSLLLILFSIIPFLLALAGLIAVKRSATARLCAAVWVYTLLMHIPMWIEYRFWLPAVPFLMVSAASGASLLLSRLAARSGSPAALVEETLAK
ncbi:MAG: glycosyltransferase family 39 protein [Blastocatellia bacterium]|nr:glycosyltransferase family 39 protein [Blastocatellia bacterium]